MKFRIQYLRAKPDKTLSKLCASAVIIACSAILFSCSPTAEDNLAEISADVPTIQLPNTATPFPTATRIPTQTPIPTNTIEPTIRATIPPLPTATEIVLPTIAPTAIPLTKTYATAFSNNGEPITVHEFGTGDTDLILIGGIHGGYEWNTVLLMYEIIDWLNSNIDLVPSNLKISAIPVMNPDGLKLLTGSSGRFSIEDVPDGTDPGRFNANGVDLNRNWNCVWEPIGYWRGQEVDAGDFPESEKETQSIRFFIQEINPAGVIFYHSAAGSLYPGYCDGIVADGTADFAAAYEKGSGFPQPQSGGVVFSYPVTGGAADYLATVNIAAFEVELTNHQDTEFERNRDGLLEVFKLFGKDEIVRAEMEGEEINCPPETEPFEITDPDDPANYIGRSFDLPPFNWTQESGFFFADEFVISIIKRDSDYMAWFQETTCRYIAENGADTPHVEVSDVIFLPIEEDLGNGPRIILNTCWLTEEYPDDPFAEAIQTLEEERDRWRDDIIAIGFFEDFYERPTEINFVWQIDPELRAFQPLKTDAVACSGIQGL